MRLQKTRAQFIGVTLTNNAPAGRHFFIQYLWVFGDFSNSGLEPPCSGSFQPAEALHEPLGRSYVTVTLVARDQGPMRK